MIKPASTPSKSLKKDPVKMKKKLKSKSTASNSSLNANSNSNSNLSPGLLKEISTLPIMKTLDQLSKLVSDSNDNSSTSFDVMISSTTTKFKSVSLEKSQQRMSVTSLFASSERVSTVSKTSTTSSSSDSVAASFTSSISSNDDLKKKILKHCTEFKRQMMKDSSTSPTVQRALFCKAPANVNVFINVLRTQSTDLDIVCMILTILHKLILKSEFQSQNLIFLANKNLPVVLLKTLSSLVEQFHVLQMDDPTLYTKMDDALSNIYTLLIRFTKYETKIPIMSRLHNSVKYTLQVIQTFENKKDTKVLFLACQGLKIFCNKNENNVTMIQKSSLIDTLDSILRTWVSSVGSIRLDIPLDLLNIMAKSSNMRDSILDQFPMDMFLKFYINSSNQELVQKSILKLLRTLIDCEKGKNMFEKANGIKIFTDSLESILKVSETSGSSFSTSALSLPALLNSLLRTAVSQTELPYAHRIKERIFPLPSKEKEYINEVENEENDDLQKSQLQAHLKYLCPESSLLENTIPSEDEPPPGNIRVRHVQPMAPGKHTVCRNTSVQEPEMQSRKSLNMLKKAFFEQTFKIFQPYKSTLVYDVMDDESANAIPDMEGNLKFDSRFESGNLQLAIKLSEFEYDLILQTDINSLPGKHNQWFYFSVKNALVNTPYIFNIINMSKSTSQFNQGMQPVLYSSADKCWRRTGEGVYYIKNHYKQPTNSATYATLTFHVTFKNPNDTCFIAYHFPFTFSELQRHIYQLHHSNPLFRKHCRRSILCKSLGGNETILLTITDFDKNVLEYHPFTNRKYVLLSSRVHPGESNSNHIMNGIIQFLCSEHDIATQLRRKYIFKIIPMLNPDGVVNGSHRCSLSGSDLNRQWLNPSRIFYPIIYWTKTLWKHLIENTNNDVMMICDFHGHSKRKNVFMYGCENGVGPYENMEKIFPGIMSVTSPVFDFPTCRFDVEKSKEGTCRVVFWREFGIINSFTLESSYCGPSTGDLKLCQFAIHDLEKVGVDFCISLFSLLSTNEFSGKILKNNNNQNAQAALEEKKVDPPHDSNDEDAQKESSESSDDDG